MAWHALYASEPREYLLQSAYLATLSLYAVGGSADLIVRHIEEILHEYQKLLQVGAIQGSA